eukprot:scaffold3845_cov17-Prasinocladus_malaysianus.AAC.1
MRKVPHFALQGVSVSVLRTCQALPNPTLIYLRLLGLAKQAGSPILQAETLTFCRRPRGDSATVRVRVRVTALPYGTSTRTLKSTVQYESEYSFRD